jgi:thiol-disulfide isomerase/thioredoxin
MGAQVEKDEPRRVAGRRTLGPAPKPGSRYSIFVGLAFLALVLVAFANLITTRESGTLGLDEETSDLPLPEFAVPAAIGGPEADANIAQDDCETSELPCPSDARRTPACRVPGPGAIRVCDLFDRPLVISFWFTRGSDCEPQQDVVSEVYERYRGRVNFLSLNVRDDRDTVRELARERGWRMPLGHDRDGAVSNLYRVGGCPTFVYAYPGGILQSAGIGELSEAELSANVRRLLRDSRRVAAADR